MGKDFYCPICGAFQENVNLEETDNTFICNKCKSVIHFEKLFIEVGNSYNKVFQMLVLIYHTHNGASEY